MLAKSPDRHTFSLNNYLKRRAEEGLTPENNEEVKQMVSYYQQTSQTEMIREQDPDWAKTNLEYDLRSNPWIVNKVKASEVYAQNLYAALCNNSFQKLEVMPILTEQHWHCSWRYAGGIVANMRESGDYIDWYCSGIKGGPSLLPDGEEQKGIAGYVPEAVVTDEIKADLKTLGWVVVNEHQ